MFNESLVFAAQHFAAVAHVGVMRKDKVTPYILHPVSCANMLSNAGFSSEMVAAALLHDVVEDTKHTIEDIQAAFGDKVAEYVNSVTEQDKSLSWEKRKELYLKHLSTDASLEAILIAFVDKIDNMRSLRQTLQIQGPDFLKVFNASPERILWYHQEVFAVGTQAALQQYAQVGAVFYKKFLSISKIYEQELALYKLALLPDGASE